MMDNEIIYVIVGAGLSILGGVIAELIRLIINNSLSKKSLQREYIYKIYDNKIEAYRDLYTELVRYRKLFIDYYFTVIVDEITPFDYKDECNKILSFYQEHEVYFSDELIGTIQVMLYSNLNNMEFLPAFIEPDNLANNEPIHNCSRETVDCIDKCLKIIKKELKIKEINKAFN
jgi:hypothetical protein